MRVCIHWQPEETCWLKLALFQLLSYLQPHDTYSKQDLSNNLPYHTNSPLNLFTPISPILLPANPPTLWPHPFTFISLRLRVSPFPSTPPLSSFLLIASPSPCFRGCLLYDEVHILRDSGSHLHFSLSPPFGVSVSLMQAQGPQKGERHTNKERQ